MGSPFIGEIRMFGGNFAPSGWAFCNGQLMPISENDALFNLIGTTYGGDGQNTFGLPDLRGRVPVHVGSGFILGGRAGVESVSLTVNQIPNHSHSALCVAGTGNQATPSGGVWAASALDQFSPAAPNAAMSPSALANAGGSQPHDNMMPYQAVSFIISLYGVFPSQT